MSRDTPEHCVAVVGMHRSGTSAMAGLLIQLGLGGPRADDLVEATANNEGGHWESHAVCACNMLLLRLANAHTYAPPEPKRRWDDVPGYEASRQKGRLWYSSTYDGKPLVIKDPRLCLTLPFWRETLPAAMGAVLVLRDPVKVARSLEARDGIPMSLGLALWDRYLRSAAVGLEGIPTLVVEYDRVLAHPDRCVEEVIGFLRRCEIEVSPGASERARGYLDSDLRHQSAQDDAYDEFAGVQRQVFDRLAQLESPLDSWLPPPLPDPPVWVDDVIRLRHDVVVKNRQLRDIKRSPVNKIIAKVMSATGRSTPAVHESS